MAMWKQILFWRHTCSLSMLSERLLGRERERERERQMAGRAAVDQGARSVTDSLTFIAGRRVSVAITTGIIPQHQQPTPAICHFIKIVRRIIRNISLTLASVSRRSCRENEQYDRHTNIIYSCWWRLSCGPPTDDALSVVSRLSVRAYPSQLSSVIPFLHTIGYGLKIKF